MTGRRRLAIALWLAGVAFCIFQITQTRFVADLSSFLPHAPTPQQQLLVDQLRDGAISRVMLIGIEGGDARVRASLSRALAAALRADALFASTTNGADAGFERERDFLLAHRYVLSPNVAPDRFTVEGLRAAISETVDLLASPAGLLVKSLVARDPTAEMVTVVENLRPPQGPRLVEGVWASPDGERALLIARTRARGSDTDAQAKVVAAVEDAFRKATSNSGTAAGAARLVMTGPGVFSVRARAMIERDVARLTSLSTLIVVAILLLVYRSPVALGLGLVPVVSGALAGITAVSLGMGAVHGITLAFGTTLIGEAVDYSIYLFVQAGDGERAGDTAWIARFWPTIRLGVLTSIAGFSAMLFSGLPGLAQLGLYSITGLAVAAAVTRFVLPAMLPARFRIRDVSHLGERLAALFRGAARLRWLVIALALSALVVLAAHRGTLWDPDISSLNPISLADRRLDAELRTAIGASDARRMIAVHGASADAALEAAERIGIELDRLVAAGKLGGYESPARFLPSAATQKARLESLPESGQLRARLRAAQAQSPLRPERLEPFVADVERARAAGIATREKIAGTALEMALDGLLFADASGRWTALLGLRAPAGTPASGVDLAAVQAAIAASGVSGAVLLDLKAEIDRLYSGYLDQALLMSAVGFAMIVALLFAALRSPSRVARVMAPLIAGVLVVAAWQALTGARLSLLHLVGLLLIVAIGSNYALFFDRMTQLDRETAGRTLSSLALANLTTVASFGALSLSSIPVLHAIGSTVALGAFATLVFAAMLADYGIHFAQGEPDHAHAHQHRGPR